MLPTFADRHAITIWYYDQTERDEAVKKAKEEGTARRVATASTESQQLAKVHVNDILRRYCKTLLPSVGTMYTSGLMHSACCAAAFHLLVC